MRGTKLKRPKRSLTNAGLTEPFHSALQMKTVRVWTLLLTLLATASAVFSAEEFSKSDTPVSDRRWADFVEPTFPFFSSVLDARDLGNGFPTNNLTPRGIILNLGHDCWACFDPDLLRVSAIWSGSSVSPVSMAQISYNNPGVKAVEGEEHLPHILGSAWLANGIYPGWQRGQLALTDPREPCPDPKEVGRGPLPETMGRFRALGLSGSGVLLEYEAGGAKITERIEARTDGNIPTVERNFRVGGMTDPLVLVLGQKGRTNDVSVTLATQSNNGKASCELEENEGGLMVVRVARSADPIEFSTAITPQKHVQAQLSSLAKSTAPVRRWLEDLVTRGALAVKPGAYVVDNIALPLDNPWKRNIRLIDLAFFSDGRAAAVTFDGDVWMIFGLGGDLDHVTWRRFSSGFHEPMGLCTRGDELFVCDRNGIWRLRDEDGNGEADVHEMFANQYGQTAETREYSHGIRPMPDGSFVIAKGGIQMSTLGKHNGSVLRISADGRSTEVLGYGLRSPVVTVHPKTGFVTASDQQGNYVPTTPIHIIRDHQFYGFLSRLLPAEKYPAPVAEPLTWIPYPINASGAGEVWLTDAKMGPLNDSLVHIAYYRPEIFRIILNNRASRTQAAVVSITRDFQFAPFNGAVNPTDGQLYITGFQIFGTSAKQISGLARVRYTGAPCTLPKEVVAMDKGVLLRFDIALDPSMATNLDNFSAERWNYKRTANYGSPHFKLDGTKGQEVMNVTSAYLSRDGKSVFLGIPDMRPVMQMRTGWTLRGGEGIPVEQNTYFTPYELVAFHPTAEGFDETTVDLSLKEARHAAAAAATAEEGQRVAELMGCVACHSNDGSTVGKAGPSWKGLFGTEEQLSTGQKVRVNDDYIRESIRQPAAKFVRGFEKSETAMPSYEGVVTDAQVEALILYIKSLK